MKFHEGGLGDKPPFPFLFCQPFEGEMKGCLRVLALSRKWAWWGRSIPLSGVVPDWSNEGWFPKVAG